MHTEIIINYEKLDRAIWRLDSYLQSLDRVEGVINTNAKMLEDQKGEVFIALEENRTSIKSGIAEQREMSTALRDSLARYREEMEQLIHPIARGQDVRVSKLDIQNNLFSIGFALDGIFSPPVYSPEHQWNPYESWVPTGIGEGYIVQDTEKIERERRNGDKIDRFIDETIYDLKKRLQSCRENIEDIYYRNVVGFVEKDDEHARYVTQNIYSEYATEHEVRMDVETARAEAGADFFRGVWGGIKGMGEGIAALMKISAAADAISNSTMLGEELPEWAVKELEDFSSGFKDMKELSDFFEMIGQSQLNTYEKEGPGYIAGSAAFEGVTAAVPVSKIAAAIKAVRLARLADKGLDAVDTGSDLARGVGELADAARALRLTSASTDDLHRYLKAIDEDIAKRFLDTGEWPKDVQLPVNGKVLDAYGNIDWESFAPKRGYVLDASGNAIKEPYVPKVGEVIDRYGPSDGGFTCPVVDDIPYSYSQRSLPYVEDAAFYHKYEIVGDIKNLKEYVKNCPNQSLKSDIDDLITLAYGGDYGSVTGYSGKIAPIKELGTSGGGIQYELPLRVDWLEELGILKEIQ